MTANFDHQPVLKEEILKHLPPTALIKTTKKIWVLDSTFGAGGHTKALLHQYPFFSILGLDKDLSAIKWGKTYIKPKLPPDSLYLIHGNFHHYCDLLKNQFPLFLKKPRFDIIIMDLGVSSPQLDNKERGFSFYTEGPLDMRMDSSQNFRADDIINTWSQKQLYDLFYHYGQIHNSKKVVQAIIAQRRKKAINSTTQLAHLIVRQTGWKKKGTHPATAYFLALRLKVNNELEGLKSSLPKMISSLNPLGRILVLSFHSLEDRIVKTSFNEQPDQVGSHLTKKVITPSREEIQKNRRSRSAKLRIFQKAGGLH